MKFHNLDNQLNLAPINVDVISKRAYKILIVDDEAFNINGLYIILENVLNIDVKTSVERASSGLEAIQKVKNDIISNNGVRCSYSLILMDCEMPVMDGYEAADKIRHVLYTNNILQPIIAAVTQLTEERYIEQAIDCGMNTVIQKPCQVEELRRIVEMVGFKAETEAENAPEEKIQFY